MAVGRVQGQCEQLEDSSSTQVRGGGDQGNSGEETWGGRLLVTVSESWFPPGFHLVRKEEENEVWFLGRAVIPLIGS